MKLTPTADEDACIRCTLKAGVKEVVSSIAPYHSLTS